MESGGLSSGWNDLSSISTLKVISLAGCLNGAIYLSISWYALAADPSRFLPISLRLRNAHALIESEMATRPPDGRDSGRRECPLAPSAIHRHH